ncbi:uncharacterized protein LOC143052163 isoform X2 [Mytilus galloprovincialis]|uniref:uncharacterized protein LOC143052163 isoform X2 n=1 Tax=Mytilus galloprovincialis TaxID=29158 RepID=UPI003F7C84D5
MEASYFLRCFWLSAVFISLQSVVNGGQLCMKCSHVVNPWDCGVVLTCGPHEECYIRRYITDDGKMWYDAGCTDQDRCKGIASIGIGKRQTSGETTICEQCCNNTAICNTKPMCGSSGIKKNGGTICFNCPDEKSPDSCDRMTTCYSHEKCLLQHLQNSVSHSYYWTSACVSEQKCQVLKMAPILGTVCCDTDLCNNAITGISTSIATSTTIAPSVASQTIQSCVDDPRVICDQSTCNTGLKIFCKATCQLCVATTNVPTTAVQSCVDDSHVQCDQSACRTALKMFCRLTCKLCLNSKPKECSDLNIRASGVHTIYPYTTSNPVDVYCQVDSGHIWTVMQKRFDGSVDFYRNWNAYKHGFGSPSSEYWLGNDNIHRISTNGPHELKILLTDWQGVTKYIVRHGFYMDNEQKQYRIYSSHYSGNAGVTIPFNIPFSTFDVNNSTCADHLNCAVSHHGAWWYTCCYYSNLNGKYYHGNHSSYADGVAWLPFHGNSYSFKKTTMMIRKV